MTVQSEITPFKITPFQKELQERIAGVSGSFLPYSILLNGLSSQLEGKEFAFTIYSPEFDTETLKPFATKGRTQLTTYIEAEKSLDILSFADKLGKIIPIRFENRTLTASIINRDSVLYISTEPDAGGYKELRDAGINKIVFFKANEKEFERPTDFQILKIAEIKPDEKDQKFDEDPKIKEMIGKRPNKFITEAISTPAISRFTQR